METGQAGEEVQIPVMLVVELCDDMNNAEGYVASALTSLYIRDDRSTTFEQVSHALAKGTGCHFNFFVSLGADGVGRRFLNGLKPESSLADFPGPYDRVRRVCAVRCGTREENKQFHEEHYPCPAPMEPLAGSP